MPRLACLPRARHRSGPSALVPRQLFADERCRLRNLRRQPAATTVGVQHDERFTHAAEPTNHTGANTSPWMPRSVDASGSSSDQVLGFVMGAKPACFVQNQDRKYRQWRAPPNLHPACDPASVTRMAAFQTAALYPHRLRRIASTSLPSTTFAPGCTKNQKLRRRKRDVSGVTVILFIRRTCWNLRHSPARRRKWLAVVVQSCRTTR